MQTILGANGQIATELARELKRNYSDGLKLVSRRPRKIHDTDLLEVADLLDAEQTARAVQGSNVVYFTAGLPPDTQLWEQQFPSMLRNALAASRTAGAPFVYFDNTYMYPQNAQLQTEQTAFAPVGRKGRVRAAMAEMVLSEMEHGEIPVLIARAPEFYGPAQTQSITNTLVIDRLKAGKTPLAPVRDDRLRTLIWTPDASRALALLGNTPDAYGQTWHLPCDDERPSYKLLIDWASQSFGRSFRSSRHHRLPRWALSAAGLISKPVAELQELLPRYAHDNLFDSSKFKQAFPGFAVTSYQQGLALIADEFHRNQQQSLTQTAKDAIK
ncbi:MULTISPECIES: NAD-dependent epimerase/dehydratase family protein [Comamonas]|uniref:NAD-dependent epimerase/dehydratase family protein n=1 Tax=Comamonas TaxID=283 RepID=UPI002112F9E6|nr:MULTISPECIES: NAD-dependent epimerase/dehydratase family protein [Comamonas]UUC91867.1 NAD-dependent epimerase/dehydratase family protein [Comamonas sp. C11]WEE75872.1 NAD-dependent epimerase/dehydratase family protein [Comamonas testosteroni]